MKLSVLDQSTASKGLPEDQAIRETLALARLCDTLGYRRYWVSEHHNSRSIVGTAPEILMAAIAATTQRIRIGSAGVMLPHYSALKVAEQFRVLEAIAPGRIDLGVGRAPGSDRMTAFALNPDAQDAAERFPQQVAELQAWVNGMPLPDAHPFHDISAHPQGPSAPDLWILGSSDYGAQLAAHFGLPYAFAYFFSDGRGVEEALRLYRDNYRPSARHPVPVATVCIWALAADTDVEARRLATTREFWRARFEKGIRLPLVSPDEAAAYPYDAAERTRIAAMRERAFVGTGEDVVRRLETEAQRLHVDEIVVVTWAHDAAARRRSYELIARAAGLDRAGSAISSQPGP
ncbi:MAG: LLM class flavin-dependent oxidoreductase [Casimicrobiaceae bacterium]